MRVDSGLAGTKTVVAFTNFALPANVQNLTFSGADTMESTGGLTGD